ncbi:MAG TPA: LamG domain-containing protein, partial [Verrucomicrobiae bacterium]|nr:LamG domain-containing protein [Verrucomicrobiae bacterium]
MPPQIPLGINNNNSVTLNGNQNYVLATNNKTINSQDLKYLTISAWVRPDYSQGSPEFTVVSKENGFALSLNNNITPIKTAKFSVFDGIKWDVAQGNVTIPQSWTFLVATFDGAQINLYVNGTLQSSAQITGIPTISVTGQLVATNGTDITSNSDIIIGAYKNSLRNSIENSFSGSIDKVKLYDSLLGKSQILALYNQDSASYSLKDNPGLLTSASSSNDAGNNTVLSHDDIVINKPVTWTENVTLDSPVSKVSIEVPSDAKLVDINSNGKNVTSSTTIAPSPSAVASSGASVLVPLDNSSSLVQDKPVKVVSVNTTSDQYGLKFVTPAPTATEKDNSSSNLYSKQVTVENNSTLHYTDVRSFSSIPEDLVSKEIPFKLYWVINGSKTDVTNDPRFDVKFVDTNGNGIADQMQWTVPKLSEQVFVIEAQITIINVQSYPVVGGNWTVMFTTNGTADLNITAINGTTFGEIPPADLQFLELKNGTHTLAP